jgi:chromosomal replication initiation ATPase DnaA
MGANPWDRVLAALRAELAPEEFRRWFGTTAYASDSGDHITVWVDSESGRRHIQTHYQRALDRALAAMGRPDTEIRFVVAGYGDEDEG